MSTTRIIGYRVEARTSYPEPCRVGEVILDGTWREVPFDFRADNLGVPSRSDFFGKKLHDENLMTRHQAQAMRHWFLAQAEAERVAGSFCLETRLVEYQLTIQVDLEVLGRIDAQDCRGKPLTEQPA